MEWPAHIQRHRTLGPGGLASVYCRSHRSRFASDDYLPRCIEVCGTYITFNLVAALCYCLII